MRKSTFLFTKKAMFLWLAYYRHSHPSTWSFLHYVLSSSVLNTSEDSASIILILLSSPKFSKCTHDTRTSETPLTRFFPLQSRNPCIYISINGKLSIELMTGGLQKVTNLEVRLLVLALLCITL